MNYYDTHAQDFIDGSIKADMTAVYNEFLPHIPNRGYILDAGCGSGRDSKYFIEQGYSVDAFDLSVEMVKHAKSITGIDVQKKSFAELDIIEKYDGVWACASLLHVPNDILAECMENCINSLKQDGILYCSFKYGTDNMTDSNGRKFTNMDENTIQEYLPNNSQMIKTWTNTDVRKDRQQKWLNVLCKRI